MYKVLIIDDNDIIRKSIIARIDWNKIDMAVIGEASDGEQAFNLICKQKPDIIINDIKMPKIDGLTLIQKTKDKFPYMQYIIVSGFDDFEYTKKAILLKVVNYILKPINDDELMNALLTAKQNIIELKEQQAQRKYICNSIKR